MSNLIKVSLTALLACTIAVTAVSGCGKNVPDTASSLSSSSVPSSSEAVSSSSAPEISSVPALTSAAPVVSSKATGSSKATPPQNTPPAPTAKAPVTSPQTNVIHVTVNGSSGHGGNQSYNIPFHAGDSAYTALVNAVGKANVEASSTGKGIYVQAINGLAEFDYGGQSGWIYSVNDTFPGISCASQMLKSGDSVKWIYTLTNGKAEEGH